MVNLATRFLLVPRLRISGALFPVPHMPSCPEQKQIYVTFVDDECEVILRR